MKINYSNIIKVGLIFNLSIYFLSLAQVYDRSFWIDETHVAGVSDKIFSKSLKEVFVEGINHFPLYFYLVGFFNLFSDNFLSLRLVNIIGLFPLFYSVFLLKNHFKELDIYFVLLLIISNYSFFYYSIELKMYFLIYCISFLQHTIFLIDTSQKNYKKLFLLISVFNSLLHVFGLVISMAMILIYTFNSLKNINLKILYYNLFSGLLLFILFIGIFYFSFDASNFKALGWLKFQKWYFRVFLEWVIPVVLFTFIMFIITFYKNGFINFFSRNSDFNYKILYITLPSIILVIVTVLISLKTPVITHRNLIVTLPCGILLCSLLSIKFFKFKGFSILLGILILITTYLNYNVYRKPVIFHGENIKWVIEETFKEECANVPVYFNDNKKILFEQMTGYAIDVYAKHPRKLMRLSEFDRDKFNILVEKNPDCKVFIASFHERKFEKHLKTIFPEMLNTNVIIAPDVLENNSKSGAIFVLDN